MLDFWRYLLGVAEIFLLVGFAWLGATQVRRRLLPEFTGAPAHLATAVLALALLLWAAELLGAVGLFGPLPYLAAMALAALAAWGLTSRVGGSPAATGPAGRSAPTLIALAIAVIAVVKFGLEVKPNLSSGMTGFDSTWYHGPFAAGFFQSGNTWDLHFIAPQFLAWFYPANSEVFHAIGMLAFDRDILSPLLNLGWFIGCLVACWCIGRPYGVASWSLGLGAIALSVPAFADQAGEARNDIVGVFFLLAAVAIALAQRERSSYLPVGAAIALGPLAVAGLSAGLAAGTKLNFLLPAAVLVIGLPFAAPAGTRWRAFAVTGLTALAGGGYWYLRNLIHTGNPLPWIDRIGPISLPAPDQALGGREGHSVLGYLTDGAVWSDWFLPGLHNGLWLIWPLLFGAALAGLLLPLLGQLRSGPSSDRLLLVAALTGLAAFLAWLVAPTSASGPEGLPRGFESGLRYLAPALVLGLSLLPVVLPLRLREAGRRYPPNGRILKAPSQLARRLSGRGISPARLATLAVLFAVAIGYPIQRHYLESRYADPSFTTPGLNTTFAWSRDFSDARIATTSTRQYPLYGTDLSNQVDFIGFEQPHGGFTAPTTCPQWRRLLNEGNYDYVVTSRDRVEPGKPPYPPSASWTEGPGVGVVLREPPTVVYQLRSSLDPSGCD